MKRMSFMEAIAVIEARNMKVFRGDGYFLTDVDSEGSMHARYNFVNGFEVVQFAKYLNANPTEPTEQVITDLKNSHVSDWWHNTSAASRTEFFKARAREKALIKDSES